MEFVLRHLGPNENGLVRHRQVRGTMEPRPKLDVMNLSSPAELTKQRKAVFKKALGPVGPIASRVLSKYRARQTKLLGESDEDPNPYSPTYVFYCLDSPPRE